MNDTHQVVLAMLALVWAGVMLVTGQLYMEYRAARARTVTISSTDRSASVFSTGRPDFVKARLAARAGLGELNESSAR
ncbi:hypothetical protein Q2941_49860 [Bradyrhizobium sp. UFLA05-153]